MPFIDQYTPETLTREDVDQSSGPMVLEFGTNWCGYCQGAQPNIREAIQAYPDVHHIKVEDGKGRRLGRTFGVKLWPTLVFLKDGEEVGRLVRPGNRSDIEQALAQLQ